MKSNSKFTGRFSHKNKKINESQRASKSENKQTDVILLYGHHTVVEALKNPQRKFIVLEATLNALERLKEEKALPKDLKIETVQAHDISRQLSSDAVHQGLLLRAHPLMENRDLDSVMGEKILLALDQITDPHNIGAIMRSACAFNVGGIILTNRHAPQETAVMAKAASGALEHVPLVRVSNLGNALQELERAGYEILGLDSEAQENMSLLSNKPTVLVLGAEGKGLRQKSRGLCTKMVKLNIPGKIKSLNVSNAAAIALYAMTSS